MFCLIYTPEGRNLHCNLLISNIEKNLVDAVFASPTECKRKLQFSSPITDGCDDPVKKVKKRKLLKTDDFMEVVSFIECL